MKKEKESKVIAEVRRIRQAHQKEARKMGRDKWIEELNRKRGFFLGRGAKYPEPEAAETLRVSESPRRKYGGR